MKNLFYWSLAVIPLLVGVVVFLMVLPFAVLCDLLCDLLRYLGGKPRS